MKKYFLFILLAGILFGCSQSGTKENTVNSNVVSAAVKTVDMKIEGMTCTGCENTIQNAVTEIPGVSSVKADHVAGKATVSYDTTKTNISTIAEAIKNAGYQVIQ